MLSNRHCYLSFSKGYRSKKNLLKKNSIYCVKRFNSVIHNLNGCTGFHLNTHQYAFKVFCVISTTRSSQSLFISNYSIIMFLRWSIFPTFTYIYKFHPHYPLDFIYRFDFYIPRVQAKMSHCWEPQLANQIIIRWTISSLDRITITIKRIRLRSLLWPPHGPQVASPEKANPP